MQGWENRIVGYTVKPAGQFLAHPLNFRRHPKAQQAALVGSLNDLGWIDCVLENVRTGHLIDGHERIFEALAKGEDTPVPCIQIDLPEELESQALLMLDPIAAMAQTDRDNLDALLRDVQSGEAGVQAMLAELAEKTGLDYGLPDLVDNSGLEDDRGNRTEPGKGQAIVSLGTWSAKVDYETVQRLVAAVQAEFGEDAEIAIPAWCEALCG